MKTGRKKSGATRRKSTSDFALSKADNAQEASAKHVKAAAQKIRRLAETAQALRTGGVTACASVTRLTSIKSLCQTHEAAMRFVLYLAERTLEKMTVELEAGGERVSALEHYRDLAAGGVAAMRAYLASPTQGKRSALYTMRSKVQGVQDEVRRIGWNHVRIIHSMPLLVVENALYCFTSPETAPTWAYQAARNYAERHDPRCGDGLSPASAPMLEEIVTFWSEYVDSESRRCV
jgi:hypothetical protein